MDRDEVLADSVFDGVAVALFRFVCVINTCIYIVGF